MEAGPVGIHHELLIAPGVRFLPLENDLMARVREIGFRILAAERQLSDVLEVHFPGVGRDRLQERGEQNAYHRSRKLEAFKPAGNVRLLVPMNDPKAPRPARQPLMDALGQLCADGKQAAEYLWQVPKDVAVRQQILDLLTKIGVESAKQGRKEMPRLVEELKIAAQATPSPQQVDVLVDGFDRLTKLWQAAKSGLL